MPRARFTAAQVHYLRQHYAELPPAHFAQRWGVALRKVYDLARRQQVRHRAPNGQPVWRGKPRAWAAGSRWAG